MSITTEILRIKGGKSDIRTMARQKNIEIPLSLRIDEYADFLGQKWPDFTYGVTYDGTKARGKTEKWNQIADDPLKRTVYYAGVTLTYNVAAHSYLIEGTSEYGLNIHFDEHIKVQINHKYLVPCVNITSSSATSGVLRIYSLSDSITLIDARVPSIFTSNYNSDAVRMYFNVGSPGVTVGGYIMPLLIDLTDKFGAGNEPTSVDDERIKKLIAYAKDHPQYDTGSLTYAYYKGIKLGEYDYIDITNNKLVLGGAEVDISQMSLTRFLFGSNYLFYGTNNDQETNTTNIISADYQTAASISDIPDMSVTGHGGTGKSLWFRDDSCATVEQFKTKNAGKKVYYKLATPIEIDLS